MGSITPALKSCQTFIEELQVELKGWVAERIEVQLEREVDAWLHRARYERREALEAGQKSGECQHCGTRTARLFWRNGHRKRQIVSQFGVLDIRLPRVICACGGSVAIPFTLLAPYQRLWEDVIGQIGRWARLGLSLRQMQTEIGEQLHTQVGLGTLNAAVKAIRQPVEVQLSSVPPIIMLDAIWVTALEGTATYQRDRLGRQRETKERDKVCVLVALGLYPQTGRWGILAWSLADSESQDAWEQLLIPLETRGVYRERGVELFIHDGGSGLTAALKLMFPRIPHQRCLFHKLRTLWHAICLPTDLPRPEAPAFKRDLLHQAQAVLWASSPAEAEQARDAFVLRWQASQPDLVATLARDWPDSIAFFQVLARFPNWPRRFLRTTSLLERVNRLLRRLFRPAGAFHSSAGLLAAVARVLFPFRLI